MPDSDIPITSDDVREPGDTGTAAEPADAPDAPPAKKAAARKRTTTKVAAKKAATKATTRTTKKTVPPPVDDAPVEVPVTDAVVDEPPTAEPAPVKKAAGRRSTTKRAAAATKAALEEPSAESSPLASSEPGEPADAPGEQADRPAKKAAKKSAKKASRSTKTAADAGDATGETAAPEVLFQSPDTAPSPSDDSAPDEESSESGSDEDASDEGSEGGGRRRRRRGGRRRRKSSDGDAQESGDAAEADTSSDDAATEKGQHGAKNADDGQDDDGNGEGTSRRRRRRRRGGDGDGDDSGGSGASRSRKSRTGEDQITAVSGSTRLEAKKQRRREGREAGRRRAPIVSEAEFLARRESVDRVMVVRQRDELTQIGVLEDKVLVEHYVSRESQTSLIGNIYLGRVQNVLPSMEAAFIDIGRGRNAVLYAGEVNWSALGHKDGQPRKIESVLSSGQTVLVQVTKDPIGQKGARLTSQISLAGRFLVYVPDGTTSGISRKLPDTERNRLKTLLKEMVPDSAGVIVRTAAEGASEDELVRDVERLTARFADIEKKTKGSAPQLLYGEPDLTVKVVRDLFTEDFTTLVIQGDDAWDTVHGYVEHVAPDLIERLERYDPAEHGGADLFSAYRVDEQIAKALDRKVWLPSGGSLVIDRTEAMTVVDVNTGKFTGSGGNLEETVTKNNLEAAEEVVRQLRLRDIGGIIVIDFIDMVLESNRDLVMRRLVECLGRDRTRHQVAEVTSLGLIQMTRKRIGTGLLEAFSEPCEHCHGRGLVLHDHPVESSRSDDEPRRGRRSRGGKGRGDGDANGGAGSDANGNGHGNGRRSGNAGEAASRTPSPREFAAMARHHDDEVTGVAHVTDVADAADADVADAATAGDAAVDADLVEEVRTDAEVEVGTDLETAAVAAAVVEEPTDEPAAEPEPPKVVTRTRRRSASRPAGPPPAVTPPADVSVVDPGSGSGVADGEHGAGHLDSHGDAELEPVGHVPVKRRGGRRR